MSEQSSLEYLFDTSLDIKGNYELILSGSEDGCLYKSISVNYVRPDNLLLISHDNLERLKTGKNIEFEKHTGKYYSKIYGYVYYTDKHLDVLPLVNVEEKWRGVIVLTYSHNLIPLKELISVIEDLEIKAEIDIEKIKDFYNNLKEKHLVGATHVFAEGKKPINGRVAKVIIDKEIHIIPGLQNDDGSINFKERNFITNVVVGELIAHYIPNIESENGIDIYNEVLEAKFDENPNYKLGINVSVSDNGVDIISNTNGAITTDDGELSVVNTLEVNRIDLSTGNIDIDGTVVIRESVQPGFKIVSNSDIIVHGSLDDCLIQSSGNLLVSGGILGADTSDIIVKGDVYASFIRNAKIFASGDIIVVNQIVNSHVISNGRIISLQGRGTIVGGTVIAKKGIYVKVLGSTNEAGTMVIAGKDIENDRRYKATVENIKSIQIEIARIKSLLGNEYLRNPKYFLSRLTDSKKLDAYNLIDKVDNLTKDFNRLDAERKEIAKLFEGMNEAIISATKGVHRGVVVQIANARRVVTNLLTGTEFYCSKGPSVSLLVRGPRPIKESEYTKYERAFEIKSHKKE